MNLQDLNNRVDANKADSAAVNRAAATANPSFDAGMDDPFDDFNDIDSGGAFDGGFGNSNDLFSGGSDAFSGGDNAFSGGGNAFGDSNPFGSSGSFGDTGGNFGLGTSGGFGLNSGFGGFGQQQQQPAQSTEDKIIDAAGKAGKASIGFFKEFVQSFKGITPIIKASWGRYSAIFGVIFAVIGVLIWILIKPQVGLQIFVGGLISAGTGIIILCFGQSDATQTPSQTPSQTPGISEPTQNQFVDDFAWDTDGEDANNFDDEFTDTFDESADAFDESADDAWADEDSGAWDSAGWDEPAGEASVINTSAVDTTNAMEALNNLAGNGLIDRRALFEKQLSVLRNITPAFSEKTEISQDNPLFNNLDAVVQESAEVFKSGNTNEVPYLISAVDTLFYVHLEISRPKYIKNVQAYTQEIVNIFQYDKETGTRDTSIYGIGEFVGQRIYIKLMKGETAFVGLKDVYDICSEKILDYNNKMPIVMGVDIEGMPVIRDFFNIESILITGAPRTGKSWFMLAILYQMMAYMSPEELHLYLFDPKGAMSDLTSLTTPHVKTFVSDDNSIVGYLRYIVNTLGSERKEFLGSNKYKTIKDYNRDHPEKKMPYIYVVIDEVVTLAERMPDEVKKEFQGLLTQLVSQLPAAGIRLFMVPHLVKDQIIKKTTTQLIPCRVSVKGNPEHIENSCGIKNFPHSLTHTGDMCVRLDDTPDGMFVHAIALAKENHENMMLFNYLGSLWAKVCPDSVPGSLYERYLNNEDLVFDPSTLAFNQNSKGAQPAACSTSKPKAKSKPVTKAAPAPVQRQQNALSGIPSQFADPFSTGSAPSQGMRSQEDTSYWGHNNITDNGHALNDVVDLWDDE